jgi:hypothetical protein
LQENSIFSILNFNLTAGRGPAEVVILCKYVKNGYSCICGHGEESKCTGDSYKPTDPSIPEQVYQVIRKELNTIAIDPITDMEKPKAEFRGQWLYMDSYFIDAFTTEAKALGFINQCNLHTSWKEDKKDFFSMYVIIKSSVRMA